MVYARGSTAAAAATEGSGWHSESTIRAAMQRIRALSAELNAGLPEESESPEEPARAQEHDSALLQQLMSAEPEPITSSSSPTQAASEHQLGYLWERVEADLVTLKHRPLEEEAWATFYEERVRPVHDAAIERNDASLQQALDKTGSFFNAWLKKGMEKFKSSEKALQKGIVAPLRHRWFGERAAQGPPWAEVYAAFKDVLPTGQLNLLKEMVLRGADPVYMGPKRGYRPKSYPSTHAADMLALWDFHALLKASRAVNFNLDEEGIEELLVNAGVRLTPSVSAHKTEAHGALKVDDWGEFVLRICNDCTNGGHRLAPNTQIRSWQHSLQKATTPATVAYRCIQEEKKHPHCEVRLVKDDIQKAFNLIATVLHRVGLFAICVKNIALVNLCLIFGSRASPGDFEVPGDAVIKSIKLRPRERVEVCGSTHPEMARVVDDIVSVVSQFGLRSTDHLNRLRKTITDLLGKHAHNLEKQGVEGSPENFKHLFGAVGDCVGRKLKAPWSKLVKFANLVLDFVNAKEATLDIHTVQRAGGVIRFALTWAPELAKLLVHRFNAMLSNAGKQFPDGSFPPGFSASPALPGEEEEASWEKLRVMLNIFLRLAAIENGELFQVSFEAALPLSLRLSFPGKEGPEDVVYFYMDAAGKKCFGMDKTTGRWLQVTYTAAENESFNAFMQVVGRFVTINNREHLTELFIAVLLASYHPGKICILLNDNRAAEHMTNTGRFHTMHDELIGSLMGLVATLLGQTFVGDRVATDANAADWFTREEKTALADEFLQQWETENGTCTEQIRVEDWPWLRNLNWEGQAIGPKTWFELAISLVDFLAEHRSEQLQSHCPVSVAAVRSALEAGCQGLEIAHPSSGHPPT